MHVIIGADHRGFALKNELKMRLQSAGHIVRDVGADQYDALDDFPVFAQSVALEVSNNPESMGVVICGSGIGVSIAANRTAGIRCGLLFSADQAKSGKQHDHLNVAALPADYIDADQAYQIIEACISTPSDNSEKYLRRLNQIDPAE